MSIALHGVIPPVPTIIGHDGRFDPAGMGRLIDHLLASKINGFLFLGSAGEFAQLSHPARKEIAEFCVRHVAGRRPVIIGTASCATDEVIELNQHAARCGADAVMVVNPYYSLLSEERIYQHYQRIAAEARLPVLLYNYPALTGHDLSIELILRLAQDCPNIIGVKDTVDCMSHIRRIIHEVKAVRPDFLVFCGFDEYLLDTLLQGGDGAIPATSNFAPEVTCGIYQAFLDNDMAAARLQLQRLGTLSRLYLMDKPFSGLLKEALRLCGVDIPGQVIAPASTPSAAQRQALKALLCSAGVLPAND